MRRWKTVAVGALLVWCVAVVVLCLLPRHVVAELTVPAGVPAATVSVTCGPAWGAPYLHHTSQLRYPIAANPCGDRHGVRVMGYIDVGLTVVVVASLVVFRRRRQLEHYPYAV